DLAAEMSEFARSVKLPEEEFVSYFAVPLIAKGQVKGVLEVLHRAPLNPTQDWLSFLEALAGQAAIAIDNSTLFDNLQRVNTDEEWVVMKKHPTYAYELLSPIHYLRLALDIPYCHHEKWDGSGYPRGLKGEEIPVASRVFAVIDVYDALTSDRPYRRAWPKEK